jgi:hypothetical protein
MPMTGSSVDSAKPSKKLVSCNKCLSKFATWDAKIKKNGFKKTKTFWIGLQ